MRTQTPRAQGATGHIIIIHYSASRIHPAWAVVRVRRFQRGKLTANGKTRVIGPGPSPRPSQPPFPPHPSTTGSGGVPLALVSTPATDVPPARIIIWPVSEQRLVRLGSAGGQPPGNVYPSLHSLDFQLRPCRGSHERVKGQSDRASQGRSPCLLGRGEGSLEMRPTTRSNTPRAAVVVMRCMAGAMAGSHADIYAWSSPLADAQFASRTGRAR